MRKQIIYTAITFLSAAAVSNAQQWNGSTNHQGNITREGDLTVIDTHPARVSLGAAWGGNPIWGLGYVGFNLRRENTGLWSYLSDGASNDGSAIYHAAAGISFSVKPSTGGFSGTMTDANISDNVLMRLMSGTNTLRIGQSIQTVSVGPAWGGGGMWGEGYIGFNLERNNVGTWDYKTDGANNGSCIIWAGVGGEINFSTKPSTGASSGVLTDVQIVNNRVFRIESNGKVVIGNPSLNINTSYTYGLYVQRGILTEKIKVAVANSTHWSDYVFAEDYKLKPLTEVESFIKENKHLPDVPSAEEVVKDGVDLGAMDATLLKKIEELTLYVIQQQKQIEALKQELLKQNNLRN